MTIRRVPTRLIAAAAAILVIGVVSVFVLRAPAGATDSILSLLFGSTEVSPAGSGFRVAADGEVVKGADQVRTGSDGHALLTFFDGSTMELEPSTTVIVAEAAPSNGATNIRLEQAIGHTWSSIVKFKDPRSRYEVKTPAATAVVRGTGMEVLVDANGKTTVRITDGTAFVTAQGVEVQLGAGQETTVLPGQPPAPPTNTAETSTLRFGVHSPAFLAVVDPFGRACGIVLPGPTVVRQIPGCLATEPGVEPQLVDVPSPVSGSYAVVIVPAGNGGDFTLTASGFSPNAVAFNYVAPGTIGPGQILGSSIAIETGPGGSLRSPGLSAVRVLSQNPVHALVATDTGLVAVGSAGSGATPTLAGTPNTALFPPIPGGIQFSIGPVITPVPLSAASPTPAATPTATPSAAPPTSTPSAAPTAATSSPVSPTPPPLTPTEPPVGGPTPGPTEPPVTPTPTLAPTASPTPAPTATPTATPSLSPSPTPLPSASQAPTATPVPMGTCGDTTVPLASRVLWTGGGDGTSWGDSANWSPTAPSSTTDACVNSAVVVEYLTGTSTVKSLHSLGSLKVYDGELSFSASSKVVELDMLGGGIGGSGSLRVGTLDVISDATLAGSGNLFLDAAGTHTLDDSVLTISRPLVNQGDLNVVFGGVLVLSGGGTSDGNFDVDFASEVEITGGTYSLKGAFTGDGDVTMSGGTITFSSTATYSVTGPTTVDGATVTFNTSSSVATADLDVISGTVKGSATIAVQGQLTWSGGSILGGGAIDLDDGDLCDCTHQLTGTLTLGKDLTNPGSVSLSGASPGDSLSLRDGAIVTNTGSFYADADSFEIKYATTPGGEGFVNAAGGLFAHNVATGTFTVSVPFDNSDSVEVQEGRLVLAGGGTSDGNFDFSSGGTLEFAGGTHVLTGASVSGTFLVLSGGTLSLGDGTSALTATPSDYAQTGGTLKVHLIGSGCTDNDLLDVNTDVALDGGLEIVPSSGCAPASSATWTIITSFDGSVTGTFDTVTSGYTPAYGSATVSVTKD